jgi:hypothetical protein
MGGNALKTFFEIEPRRILTEEIPDFTSYVTEETNSIIGDIQLTHFYKNKKDHGDLDYVVTLKKQPENLGTFLKEKFRTDKIHHNSNCYSILVDGAQVDLIFVSPEKFEAECAFRHYSPFGNIYSRLLKQIGVSWKTSGLYYPLKYSDSDQLGNIFLTSNMKTILDLGGLDYKKWWYGFDKEEDIFDHVSSSPLFRKEIYYFENLNHTNRKRDRIRPDYCRWNNYILKKEDNITEAPNEEQWLETLSQKFPHLTGEVIKLSKQRIKSIHNKSKFNGHIVSLITGLTDKQLGEFIQLFSSVNDIDEICETKTFKEIKTLIHDYFVNEYTLKKICTTPLKS